MRGSQFSVGLNKKGLNGRLSGTKGTVYHNINTKHPGSKPNPAKKKTKARAKRKAVK